jgi:hypothetical protein
LRKGDRGKNHNIENKPSFYGEKKVSSGVDGAELLEAFESGKIALNDDGFLFF